MPLWASVRVGKDELVGRTLAGFWLGCAADDQLCARSEPDGLGCRKSALILFVCLA
jgi:hypothetical protein